MSNGTSRLPDAAVELPADQFQQLFRLIAVFEDSVKCELGPTTEKSAGWTIATMCRNKATLISTFLFWSQLRAMGLEVEVKRPVRFVINVSAVLTVLSNAGPKSTVAVEASNDDNRITIHGSNASGHTWCFHVATQVIELETPEFPSTAWTRTAVDTGVLATVIANLRKGSSEPTGADIFAYLSSRESGSGGHNKLVVKGEFASIQGGFDGGAKPLNGPVRHGVDDDDILGDVAVCVAAADTMNRSRSRSRRAGASDTDGGRSAETVLSDLRAFCGVNKKGSKVSDAPPVRPYFSIFQRLRGGGTSTGGGNATAATTDGYDGTEDDEDDHGEKNDPAAYRTLSYGAMTLCAILKHATPLSDKLILNWATDRPLMLLLVNTKCDFGPTTLIGIIKIYVAPKIDGNDDDDDDDDDY